MDSLGYRYCKQCGKRKALIFLKKIRDRRIFIDDTGRQWHGRLCPICRSKNNNRG